MGLAPVAHVLWSRIMRYDPTDPKWPGRDRFVLSNGHACALLYTMLHLTGYDLSMDDLKAFRQVGSKCVVAAAACVSSPPPPPPPSATARARALRLDPLPRAGIAPTPPQDARPP